jgi:hypothetical protein
MYPQDQVNAKRHADDIAEGIREGVPSDLFAAVETLSDEQRLALFAAYCTDCGCADSRCQCWNDE